MALNFFNLTQFKGALNETQIIQNEGDLDDLKAEFKSGNLGEILIQSHDLNRQEKVLKIQILLAVKTRYSPTLNYRQYLYLHTFV